MSDNPPPGWYKNANGERQWWDGSGWGPVAEKPATSSAPADQKPPSAGAKGCGIGCLVIIAIAVIIGIASSIAANNPANKAERDRENAPIYAEIACKDAVESRLKAPSTAKFVDVQSSGSGSTFKVVGSVDAENGFGAMVRSNFSCDVTVNGDHTLTTNVIVS